MTVPPQYVTNPVSLPCFHCLCNIPFLLDYTLYFVSHTTGPLDLLNPSPTPHFKTFKAFLIYFLKCPSFSTTKVMLRMCHFTCLFLLFMSNLLVQKYFFLLNAASIMIILVDLILHVHLASFVTKLPK